MKLHFEPDLDYQLQAIEAVAMAKQTDSGKIPSTTPQP